MAAEPSTDSEPSHQLSSKSECQGDRALYEPRNPKNEDFRLLVVHSGRHRETVRAELYPARLHSGPRPQYETISYCWGDPKLVAKIHLNGKMVSVPASSAAAIRCVRLPDRNRVIWIDAVCINQRDLDERAQQVAMMAEVYTKSTGNLVYLGEQDSVMERAIQSINIIIDDIKRRTTNFWHVEGTAFSENRRTYFNDVSCDVDEAPLVAFFSNDWFQRVWAFQEAALAPWSLCFSGHSRVDLMDVLRVARWTNYNPGTYSYPLSRNAGIFSAGDLLNFVDKRFGFFHKIRAPRLEDLLVTSRKLMSSEGRDHVYGLLGLWSRGRSKTENPRGLVPDYHKPAGMVFRDAVRTAIEETGSLYLFGFISHRCEEDLFSKTIPSWVLQMDRVWDPSYDPYHIRHDQYANNCFSIETSTITASKIENVLVIPGICLGEVAQASPVLTQDIYSDWEMLRAWIADVLKDFTSSTYTPNDVAMILLAGRDVEASPATLENIQYLLSLMEYLDKEQRLPCWVHEINSTTLDHEHAASQCLERMVAVCKLRRVFITGNGNIGVGPKLTRVEDIVAILYGGSVPYVLRPCGEEYRLVGACYVGGVMEGQAMKQHKESGNPNIEFRIR